MRMSVWSSDVCSSDLVRGINGEVVQTFARERRVVLEYEEYPRQMIEAFLAAEDRTFFQHSGIDYPGILRAVITNLTSSGRPVGASTITQQVAKNLLLTNELSYTRKIKEAFLARRIEDRSEEHTSELQSLMRIS